MEFCLKKRKEVGVGQDLGEDRGRGLEVGEEDHDLDQEEDVVGQDQEKDQDHIHVDVLVHVTEERGPETGEDLNQERDPKVEEGLENQDQDRNQKRMKSPRLVVTEMIKKKRKEVKNQHRETKKAQIQINIKRHVIRKETDLQKKAHELEVPVVTRVDLFLERRVILLHIKEAGRHPERKVALLLERKVDLLLEGKVGHCLGKKADLHLERKVVLLPERKVVLFLGRRADLLLEKKAGLHQERKAVHCHVGRVDHLLGEKVGHLEEEQDHLEGGLVLEVEGKVEHLLGAERGHLERVDRQEEKEAGHHAENEVEVQNGGADHLLHLHVEDLPNHLLKTKKNVYYFFYQIFYHFHEICFINII